MDTRVLDPKHSVVIAPQRNQFITPAILKSPRSYCFLCPRPRRLKGREDRDRHNRIFHSKMNNKAGVSF